MDQVEQFPVSWGPQFTLSDKVSTVYKVRLRQACHASARAKAMFMERGAYPQPSQVPDPRCRSTGVPRHLVLGEDCSGPISSGHLLTPNPHPGGFVFIFLFFLDFFFFLRERMRKHKQGEQQREKENEAPH